MVKFCESRHRNLVTTLINDEVTLKRYLVHLEGASLQGENPKCPDLILTRELVIQASFVLRSARISVAEYER